MCFSPCPELVPLLSEQSGRPLVEREEDMESFGRLNGLGVPGPFTFLHYGESTIGKSEVKSHPFLLIDQPSGMCH